MGSDKIVDNILCRSLYLHNRLYGSILWRDYFWNKMKNKTNKKKNYGGCRNGRNWNKKLWCGIALNTIFIENQISKVWFIATLRMNQLYLQCVRAVLYAQMTEYLPTKDRKTILRTYKVNCRKYYIPDSIFTGNPVLLQYILWRYPAASESISRGISGSWKRGYDCILQNDIEICGRLELREEFQEDFARIFYYVSNANGYFREKSDKNIMKNKNRL